MKLALKVTGLSSPVMECRIDHGPVYLTKRTLSNMTFRATIHYPNKD